MKSPDGYVGRFGWLCGYSADAAFLNDAAERFSRQVDRQRAFAGRVALALMLDPGNPQISSAEAPGVLHLPIRTGPKPFNLLHAKVALLGFRSEVDQKQWLLRLIVSTGNWTRQTLEESLDLAWTIEIASSELGQRLDADVKQRYADFKAAWDCISWLRERFDCRALKVAFGDRLEGPKEIEDWLAPVIERNSLPLARFFDSRARSLLAQLPTLVRKVATDTARNYLAMGSGYYETPDDGNAIPSVLADIVDELQQKGLLTRTPDVDVFVNPLACQGVAASVIAIRKREWHVRKAGQPSHLLGRAERALHAKFLFGANWRENSDACKSAWLYLGSGNLTKPGFRQKMSELGGNLEAGVVFEPSQKLLWWSGRRIDQDRVVTNFLPLQWDDEFEGPDANLAPGSDMPEREDEYVSAPVAYFTWEPADDRSGGWLKVGEMEATLFDVVDTNGSVCNVDHAQGIWWPHPRPAHVNVRWEFDGRKHTTSIPVLDEFGRLGGTALSAMGLDDAWQHLASFPLLPDEEDLPPPEGELPEAGGPGPGRPAYRTGESANYPIRRMMQLIEDIAIKQTSIEIADWAAWCVRLEQSLSGASASAVVQRFADLSTNPLSPLWHRAFRPNFAEDTSSIEGAQYEGVLKRIECAWNVHELQRLEA